jgi:hypothetical protein
MFNTPKRGPALPFNFPYIAGASYAPGLQPNSPGESAMPYGTYFHVIPWPNAVPSINALSNFAGMPRDYPIAIVNNANAPLPTQFLFFGGFSGKSKG